MKLIEYSKGVDFDWDLSDKTDTETQTRRGTTDPHVGPADAIVQVFVEKHTLNQLLLFHSNQPLEWVFFLQTDQRIVFHNSKAVRFSNSGGEKAPAGRKKSSASQTRWELKDKEVQVHSNDDLGLRKRKNCSIFIQT